MRKLGFGLIACATFITMGTQAVTAAEIKVLAAGAMRAVLVALVPQFERRTGQSHDRRCDCWRANHHPGGRGCLARMGKIAAGGRTDLAMVGMGVAVEVGAVVPDIATLDAFKRMLLSAKSVAYIDPKAGGSSGIYFDKVLDRLGIGDQIRPKAKLKQGGKVAELAASGEAEVAVHQISEIVPIKGVGLVGPLPAEIRNTTVYAAGLGDGLYRGAGVV
jgi:molybdate transport system substrate-binding protein